MGRRATAFMNFSRAFLKYALYVREALMGLVLLIVLGGIVVSIVEDLKIGDGIYFAFVTGLSVGYGDITPQTVTGRIASVAVGLIGMVFIGVSVAVANEALRDAFGHRTDAQR